MLNHYFWVPCMANAVAVAGLAALVRLSSWRNGRKRERQMNGWRAKGRNLFRHLLLTHTRGKITQGARLGLDVGGLETLEGVNLDVLDVGVELLLSVLVVVALAGDLQAHAVGDRLDTTGPDGAVELGGKTDVRGAHVLSGELANALDGLGGTLLEGAARRGAIKRYVSTQLSQNHHRFGKGGESTVQHVNQNQTEAGERDRVPAERGRISPTAPTKSS